MLLFDILIPPACRGLSVAPAQGAGASTEARKFLVEALQDSLAEIELCEMALQKTADDDVKRFAQTMIDQHSEMGRQIEQLAASKHAPLPKDEGSKRKATLATLSKLSGAEFDRRFIEHNVKDHQDDVETFNRQAQQLDDKELKAFAQQGAQMLQQHLDMAKRIQQKLQG